jgi:hypothetical protein
MKELLAFLFGVIAFQLVFLLVIKPLEKPDVEIVPTITKCDSIIMANDSLCLRITELERRVTQYRIGLGFLKDKDKKAYDYTINAGILKFHED